MVTVEYSDYHLTFYPTPASLAEDSIPDGRRRGLKIGFTADASGVGRISDKNAARLLQLSDTALRECCEHRRYLCRSSYLAMSNAGNETPARLYETLLGVLYTWLRDAPFRRLET